MQKPAKILHLETAWGITFTRLSKKEFTKKLSRPDFIQKCFYVTDDADKIKGIICRMELEDVSFLLSFPDLTHLDLNYNQLNDMNILSSLTNLTHLSLVGNYIWEVNALAALKKLAYLDLSDNQLSDVSTLASLINLTYLDLSYNHFIDVNVLESLPNLTHLFLSYHQISSIHQAEQLYKLCRLETIGFSGNSLSTESDICNALLHLQAKFK